MVEVLGRGDGKEEDKRGIDDEELLEHKGRMKVAAMGRRVIDKWGIDKRNER